MGGLTRDKKSYLAPFSRYLHIYVQNYYFMHILNISTSAGHRTFSWTHFAVKWSIYGGSYSGQKVVSLTVTALFAYGYELCIQIPKYAQIQEKKILFFTPKRIEI